MIHFPMNICLLSSYFISLIFQVCLTVFSAESSNFSSVGFSTFPLMGATAAFYDRDVWEELPVLCGNDLFSCSEFLTG